MPTSSLPGFASGQEIQAEFWQLSPDLPNLDLNGSSLRPVSGCSNDDLGLLQHLSSLCHDRCLRESSDLPLWTHDLPQLLEVAASNTCVMHALLSFSACHLKWLQHNPAMEVLQRQYGAMALQELHEEVGRFAPANADAILAASALMLWQATNWSSWSSLRSVIQMTLHTMHGWKHETLFSRLITVADLVPQSPDMHHTRVHVNVCERDVTIQGVLQHFHQLRCTLVELDLEAHWVDRILSHLTCLQASPLAQSSEEQFSQFNTLRWWLYWLPISLLKQAGRRRSAVRVLEYFYAASLALEPLFPDIGTIFGSVLSSPALENILKLTTIMRERQSLGSARSTTGTLMDIPHQIVSDHLGDITQGTATAPHHNNQAPSGSDPRLTDIAVADNLNSPYAFPTHRRLHPGLLPASNRYLPDLGKLPSLADTHEFCCDNISWEMTLPLVLPADTCPPVLDATVQSLWFSAS